MQLQKPIARGNTADIHLSGGSIVKLFHERFAKEDVEHEARQQQFALSCGLPVPKIVGVTRIGSRQALLMEYIEGPSLGDLMLQNPGQAETFLSLSVDIQRMVHAKRAVTLEPMQQKLARQIRASARLNAACRAFLLERLARLPHGDRLCHGDFHAYNLIQTRDGVFILDWVDSSAGNPRADVCRTHLLLAETSTALAAAYLRLYCQKSGQRPGDILVWLPVIAGARLSEGVPPEKVAFLLQTVQQAMRA